MGFFRGDDEKDGVCRKVDPFGDDGVRTVNYSVLVNGNPVGQIYPSQGIWQGDGKIWQSNLT